MEQAHHSRDGRLNRAAVKVVHAALGLALAGALESAAHGAPLPPLSKAQWVWSNNTNDQCDLRKVFTLDSTPTNAAILITADNGYDLSVNGARVGSDTGAAAEVWQSVERYDITSRLVKGRNIVRIHGIDLGGVRGVIAAVRVEAKDQTPLHLVTDGTWRASDGKQEVDFRKVRDALAGIGYTGPVQSEGAVPGGGKLIESYVANRQFLRNIFPARA